MFLGHFAVGLAAKRATPKTSLGALILGATFLDLLWPILLLLGVESVRIVPGITKTSPFDFVSYPWSHSLLMAIVWGAVIGHLYRMRTGNLKGGLVVSACVVSHWVLDLLVHRPDLPLVPWGGLKVGLGIWNSLAGTLAIEGLMFAAGIAIYLHTTAARDRIGSIAFWCFVGFLAITYAASLSAPPPPNAAAIAISDLALWLLVLWAAWFDRHRVVRVAG